MSTEGVSPISTYRSVAILRPGVFTDANGQSVSFTDDDLRRIADNYDPAYHTAALNLDHAASGPAQGFIADLVWDGAYLLADIAGVPGELAAQLGAGRYPYRSAEVYADLDGRGPYLRSLALLGARPPAVKGLPPLPQAQGAGTPNEAAAGGPWASAIQTSALRAGASPTAQPLAAAPRIITLFMEAPMPYTAPATAVAPPPAPATQVPAPAHAAPSQALAQVAPAPALAPDETIRLAEENQRLAEDALRLASENQALKAQQRGRDVRFFMAELRHSGQLTPALERSGVEQALLLAEQQPLLVALPDGRSALLSAVLRELLRALPVSFAFGEQAPAAATPARLSPEDEAVMAALGLSAEEYRGS
jgi:hypothetical protein